MAEIMIYEDIGYVDWDGNGLTALSVNQQLNDIPMSDKVLNIRINSVGGLVSDGIAIYNSVRRLSRTRNALGAPIAINTYVEGFAYSSAATVAMSGDKIYMGKGSSLMIHNASGFAWGDSGSLREEADRLDRFNGQIAQFYADRSKKDLKNILALMDDETYFTPEEAINMGLADALDDAVIVNFSRFADELELLKGLPVNRQFDTYMRDRIKNRAQTRQLDKKSLDDYISASSLDMDLLAIELAEAEAA